MQIYVKHINPMIYVNNLSDCRGCALSIFYLGEQDLFLMDRESIPKDRLASSLIHTCKDRANAVGIKNHGTQNATTNTPTDTPTDTNDTHEEEKK